MTTCTTCKGKGKVVVQTTSNVKAIVPCFKCKGKGKV